MSRQRRHPALVRRTIGPGWDETDVEIRLVSPDGGVQGIAQILDVGDVVVSSSGTVSGLKSADREYERLHTEQLETHTGPEAVTRVVEGKP